MKKSPSTNSSVSSLSSSGSVIRISQQQQLVHSPSPRGSPTTMLLSNGTTGEDLDENLAVYKELIAVASSSFVNKNSNEDSDEYGATSGTGNQNSLSVSSSSNMFHLDALYQSQQSNFKEGVELLRSSINSQNEIRDGDNNSVSSSFSSTRYSVTSDENSIHSRDFEQQPYSARSIHDAKNNEEDVQQKQHQQEQVSLRMSQQLQQQTQLQSQKQNRSYLENSHLPHQIPLPLEKTKSKPNSTNKLENNNRRPTETEQQQQQRTLDSPDINSPSRQRNDEVTPKSTGRSSTISSLVDEDIEQVSGLIDVMTGSFRKDIMGRLFEIRAKLLRENEIKTEKLMNDWRQEISDLQGKIDRLTETIQQKDQKIEDGEKRLESAATILSQREKRKREAFIVAKTFAEWKTRLAQKRAQRFMQQTADKMARDNILRSIFTRWRSRTTTAVAQSRESYWTAKIGATSAEIQNDYEAKLGEVTRQLALAQAKIHDLLQEKELMSENLKKAFMRGVCAMNLEAMSILNEAENPLGVTPSLSSTNGFVASVPALQPATVHQPSTVVPVHIHQSNSVAQQPSTMSLPSHATFHNLGASPTMPFMSMPAAESLLQSQPDTSARPPEVPASNRTASLSKSVRVMSPTSGTVAATRVFAPATTTSSTPTSGNTTMTGSIGTSLRDSLPVPRQQLPHPQRPHTPSSNSPSSTLADAAKKRPSTAPAYPNVQVVRENAVPMAASSARVKRK